MDALFEAYPDAAAAVQKVVVDRDELTLHIAREHLIGVATVLRNDPNLRFELCSSVSGVDYLGSVNRLHSVVHLTSMTYRRRVRLEVSVSLDDPHVPSLTGLYPTADWQERETYDFFGIIFKGHPQLKRILNMDEMVSFPMRKEFPLEDGGRTDKDDRFFGRTTDNYTKS